METGVVRLLQVDLMADPESGMVDNAVYTLHSLWALVRDALPPSGSVGDILILVQMLD